MDRASLSLDADDVICLLTIVFPEFSVKIYLPITMILYKEPMKQPYYLYYSFSHSGNKFLC